MRDKDNILRAVRNLGLAAWFGGSLMGARGVNGAARAAGQTDRSVDFANEAWRRWSPLNLVAVGACVIGETGLAVSRIRAGRRRDLPIKAAATEAALTAAALTASGYARRLGSEMQHHTNGAPTEHERSTRVRLSKVEWAVPVLTGLALVIASRQPSRPDPASSARDARRLIGRWGDVIRARVGDDARHARDRLAELRPA
jgi:hypothetical protein